jgi:hypothetical protein
MTKLRSSRLALRNSRPGAAVEIIDGTPRPDRQMTMTNR